MKRLLLLLLPAMIIAGCDTSTQSRESPAPDHLITFSASPELAIFNIRTTRFSRCLANNGKVVELAWPGTEFWVIQTGVENNFALVYDPSLGQNISLEIKDFGLYANGKLVSILFNDTNVSAFMQWAKTATAEDFDALQTIITDVENAEKVYPTLLSITENYPKIRIYGEKNQAYVDKLIQISQPRYHFLDLTTDTGREQLRTLDFSQLVYLRVVLPKSNYFDVAAHLTAAKMPKLSHLQIESSVTWDFLRNLGPLPCLTINNDPDIQMNLGGIDVLKGLESLIITDKKRVSGLTALAKLTDLEHFYLQSEAGIPDVSSVKGLTYLAVTGLKHQEIETLIGQNPDLVYLDLSMNNEIITLKNLPSLEHLKAVGLPIGTGIDQFNLSPLSEIPTLRHIAYNQEKLEGESDTAYEARLKATEAKLHQVCPECTLNVYEGFCMGSGWLLLILPAFGLLYFIQRRRQAA